MVGSNNGRANANSIPPPSAAMVPQVALSSQVEAIDNYILPQSIPGYHTGMSTHQVAASLGLHAHEAYTNKQPPHPQPLQPEFVSSTASNNNDVLTESKKADSSPRMDDPLAQLGEAIGFLRTLNLNHSMKKQHERKLLEPPQPFASIVADVVSTESKKADSPRMDDPLAKLDEAIGFLRTLNLNHSMKKQHERKLLPEEVKQEDLPNVLVTNLRAINHAPPSKKVKKRLAPRYSGKDSRPLEASQAMYMSIEEIKQLEAEVDGCWDYKQEILSEMASPNDKNVTPNKEKWIEEVRQHKILSKKSARITKLQQSYLCKNARLQYFLNWQQSKTRMESVTEFVNPKYRKITVDSGEYHTPSIPISLTTIDSNCIESIRFQIKVLQQICDDQDLCHSGYYDGDYYDISRNYYDECHDIDKNDDWINLLTKIEEDIVRNGQYSLPVVQGLDEAETRIMDMEDYEPPDTDHITLVNRCYRNKQLFYSLRYKAWKSVYDIWRPNKALQSVFGSNKLLLLRSLLARHVRRYHRMLEKKLVEGDKFLDSDRFIEMHKLKEECIRLRMLRYKTIENVLAYPKHDYEQSQYETRVRLKAGDPRISHRNIMFYRRFQFFEEWQHWPEQIGQYMPERTSQPMNMYVGATETEWNAIMYMLRRCISLSPKRKAEQLLIKEKVLDSQRRKLTSLGVIIVPANDYDLYIPPPADSKRERKVYLKSEAVCIVTSQSYKHTPERKALIDAIANANYVSSARTLYDVVGRFEKGESITDDRWARGKQWYVPSKSTFNKQNITMPTSVTSTEITNVTGISFEYKRYDSAPMDTSCNINFKSDRSRRVGNIILKATPVTFNQLELMESSCRVRTIKRPKNQLCPDISDPTHIDISAYIESLPPQQHVMERKELSIWWKGLSSIERRIIWWLNPSIVPLCSIERILLEKLSLSGRYGFSDGNTDQAYHDHDHVKQMEQREQEITKKMATFEKTMNARNKVCRMYFSAAEFPPPSPPTFEFCRTGEQVILGEWEDGDKELGGIYYDKDVLGGPVDVGYDPRYLVPTSRNLLAELGVELTMLYHELWSAQGEDQFREEKDSNEFETGNQYDPRKPKALRDTGNDSGALSKLIDYIRRKSSECGSPVVCTRARKKNQRTFQCQACYGTGRDCISLDLRWDRFGFYIHVLNSHGRMQTVGNMSHHPLCPHNLPEEIKNIRLDESLRECLVWGCKTLSAVKFCASHAVVEAKEECVECRRWFLYQHERTQLRDQRCRDCLRQLGISDSWQPRENLNHWGKKRWRRAARSYLRRNYGSLLCRESDSASDFHRKRSRSESDGESESTSHSMGVESLTFT